jgi:hypothetical protein
MSPEDCGGSSGYQNLLEILKNPKHEDYKAMKEWLERVSMQSTLIQPRFDSITLIFAGIKFWECPSNVF